MTNKYESGRAFSNLALCLMQSPDDFVAGRARVPETDEYSQQKVVLYDHLGRQLNSEYGGLKVLDRILDYTQPLIEGALTSDGKQWGAGENGNLASAVTVVVNTWYTLYHRQLNLWLPSGPLLWAELGLTIELSANADDSTGEWQWQGSNDDVTYVGLHPVETEADIDTTVTGAIERTMQGYPRLYDDFSQMPFHLRLRVRCTSAGDTVTARVKSSSYARALWLPD